jgi:hypothetical protein
MTTRRERAKAQTSLSVGAKTEPKQDRNELLFELGKYCFDLSKLAFGGVVLVNALHFTKESAGELIAGLAFMAGFLAFGSVMVKRATNK